MNLWGYSMRNSFNKRRIISGIIISIIIALIIISAAFIRNVIPNSEDNDISVIISFFEALGLIISLIIAIYQLVDSKEIARATFITEINKSFVENSDYMNLYDALQNCYDNKCEYKSTCSNKAPCRISFPKSVASNYLTFFESIYLLKKKGVISFELLDNLFAYRFFLAVHSKFVQEAKLKPQPQNFINIFHLEHEWLLYRRSIGKDTNKNENTVYNRNLLEDIEFPNGTTYKELIK